ncbi:hypothetical protein [Hymenobacter cellulosilyticus]|uniref:Uncharacterized protein n=1 Tax=Hymenobacter cellulosilyticus TaxID=2932248 RepID=A0A8T9Q3A8_9BACT|nr:hypothetical protein [Hymenobacter cellulosilyticus]UOQ71525.1 hypothetical protein MUN79_23375 [Hymenobacter cellulosilyticus]
MNLEELKPLWEAHKQDVEQHDLWSEAQLAALLPQPLPKPRWALRPRRVLLQLSLALLSFGFSSC